MILFDMKSTQNVNTRHSFLTEIKSFPLTHLQFYDKISTHALNQISTETKLETKIKIHEQIKSHASMFGGTKFNFRNRTNGNPSKEKYSMKTHAYMCA